MKETLRVGSMFKSHYSVIRITDHDHLAPSVMLTPVPDPQVE